MHRERTAWNALGESDVPDVLAPGLTALLIIRGAEALLAGEARGRGVLAPAEAFDARTFAGRLEPYLRIVE